MQLLDDTLEALRFFSRLPIPRRAGSPPADAEDFPRALRRAPMAGAVLGLGAGLVLLLAREFGLPMSVAAWLTLACATVASGAMHEDGLADVADGFGGGFSRERRLEIMRDSRIGAFGAVALILSFGLRSAAMAGLAAAPGQALAVLVAAGAMSRAACLAPLFLLPPARDDGAGRAAVLSLEAARSAFGVALAFVGLPFLAGIPLGACLLAALLAAIAVRGFCALAGRMIGGQTGDVAGAAQQIAEIVILMVFSGAVG